MAVNLATLSTEELCNLVATGKVSPGEMAKILQQRNGTGNGAVTAKVGPKGTIVLGGCGQWPHTFYLEQWYRVLAAVSKVEALVVKHHDQGVEFSGLTRVTKGGPEIPYSTCLSVKDPDKLAAYREKARTALEEFITA